MFRKVLIANRGEIAVRVIRTCREMGIRAVAVFSEADRVALHVRMADEAYLIGPPPSRESYLSVERILEAAKRSGADAIHPGYGFLSENPEFARAAAAAGITFIGPPPAAMEAMGEKTFARRRMIAAGVPVIPGLTHAAAGEAELLAAARDVGLPVMLKAAAGGGGKGMRIVDAEKDLWSAFQSAQREAKSAFGDDRVYLEKAIPRPRHIEIQIFGDGCGNVIHLGERECSVQRRHQKVIEETPSPLLTPEMRAAMGAVAVRAAKAVGYAGAGTVEFLASPARDFYFMEMNTRLQVEHPVTEWVTGADLVRWQIEAAAGKRLAEISPEAAEKGTLAPRGHAIEARIYAEDPARGFAPCPGLIAELRQPSGLGVRDDSGVYAGYTVPIFYDPMISKLSTWGATRARAIARLDRALAEYVVRGITTNVGFLRRVLRLPEFAAGDYDTGLLGRNAESLRAAPDLTARDRALAAAAIDRLMIDEKRAAQLAARGATATSSGWRRRGWRS